MDITYFLITTFLLFLILHLIKKQRTNNDEKLPPGPAGLPVLGHFLHIVINPHLKLSKWARQFGKIYTIRLGTKKTVVMSTPKVMKAILGTHAGTGKFQSDNLLLISRGPYGILNTEGDDWYEVRRFCLKNLKEYGLGSRKLEPLIQYEADVVIDWIRKENRESFGRITSQSLYNNLQLSTNSSLWSMITGLRLPFDDAKLNDLLREFIMSMQYSVKTGLSFYPWLKHVSSYWSGYDWIDKTTSDVHNFIQTEFQKHKQTFDEATDRDMMDRYIRHLKEVKDPQSPFYGKRGYLNTIASLVELFVAGGETASATICWALNYLALNSHVQSKLIEEIENVIGLNTEPSLEDKMKMPYMEAVLLETFRYCSLVPIGIIHRLLDDIQYEEFIFKKGTLLIANIYHVHHNKEIWGDPENFRPERFLEDESGALRENIVIFQPGRRSCPGESLGKDLLFMYLTKFLQKFEIMTDPNTPREKYIEPDVGIILMAKPNKIIFKERS